MQQNRHDQSQSRVFDIKRLEMAQVNVRLLETQLDGHLDEEHHEALLQTEIDLAVWHILGEIGCNLEHEDIRVDVYDLV